MNNNIKNGPLKGLTVLDLTRVLAGPYATMILSDLGARIIKVEPPTGDDSREFSPFINDQSAYFASLNREKESIKIDLKDKKDVYEAEKRKLTAQRLFLNLDPLPDAWKLVDYCMNSGIHTEILTAAGTVNRTLVIQDKIAWIRRHIHPHWIVVPTFKGSQKAAFAHKKAVLIDDRQRNIDCWVEAGGIGILHKTADETIEQLNYIINTNHGHGE